APWRRAWSVRGDELFHAIAGLQRQVELRGLGAWGVARRCPEAQRERAAQSRPGLRDDDQVAAAAWKAEAVDRLMPVVLVARTARGQDRPLAAVRRPEQREHRVERVLLRGRGRGPH